MNPLLLLTKTEILIRKNEDAVVKQKGQGLAQQQELPVSVRDLLESGAHFGHQKRRWNPKMKRYIFEERNGICIIDLAKTIQQLKTAVDVVDNVVGNHQSILFVGTKKQVLTQEKIEPLKEQCKRELIEICLEYPNNDLSRDIKNMVFFTPTQKEQESLDFIESLNEKRSLEGTSPLENTLIDINLEFLIKSSLLTEDRKDRMILQLEKLAKMKELCEKEEKIKTYFETAYSISPKTEASCTVKKHLQALGSKQALPQNTMEEEVQAVMIKYAQSRHPTKS